MITSTSFWFSWLLVPTPAALLPKLSPAIEPAEVLPEIATPLLVGWSLYNKEEHKVFCRVGEVVYQIGVKSPVQQSQILQTIQAAQQAMPKK